MKISRTLRIREIYVRWMGIPILAVFALFAKPEHHATYSLGFRYFEAVLYTAVYWNGAFMIFMLFRRKFPEISQTPRRLVITYILLFVWMSIGGIPVSIVLGNMGISGILEPETYTDFMVFNSLSALIIGTAYETAFFFDKWKEAIKQNEALKNQQIRTQFEVLQNQMSPHFLFNSLNTLTTLIAENQQVAIDFTQKLSDVYRYILQNKERELVPLHEELEFAKDYLFLLKMRYPDNLTATFRVEAEYQSKHIAPLTLQMLIENAIKHNVVSRSHPLSIDIYVENGRSIVVKNNLQKKQAIEKGTKTGLQNIEKRYEYLGNRKIDVITTAKSFLVAVPLIEVEQAVNSQQHSVGSQQSKSVFPPEQKLTLAP